MPKANSRGLFFGSIKVKLTAVVLGSVLVITILSLILIIEN